MRTALPLAVLAACGGAGVPDVPSFRFTQPVGVGEAFRRQLAPFDVAWETDATADSTLEVALRLDGTNPADARYASERFALPAASARWSLEDGPPGIFRLAADIVDGDDTLASFVHPGVVIAQGVVLRDADLALPGPGGELDVWVTVSTASVLVLDLVAIPDADPGARTSLGRTSVASDLAPIGRVFPWDDALPAGDYTVVASVRAANDTVIYDDGTSRVHWR